MDVEVCAIKILNNPDKYLPEERKWAEDYRLARRISDFVGGHTSSPPEFKANVPMTRKDLDYDQNCRIKSMEVLIEILSRTSYEGEPLTLGRYLEIANRIRNPPERFRGD